MSSTLERPGWNNSTVLNGDVLAGVSKLKHELTGEILVPASFQLVHALMEHDLVDELRLKVFPVVLGAATELASHYLPRPAFSVAASDTKWHSAATRRSADDLGNDGQNGCVTARYVWSKQVSRSQRGGVAWRASSCSRRGPAASTTSTW